MTDVSLVWAVLAADVNQAEAWDALAAVHVDGATRLSPAKAALLEQLQTAARDRVVETTNIHAALLAKYRAELQR